MMMMMMMMMLLLLLLLLAMHVVTLLSVQEVQSDHWKQWLLPALKSLGYDCVYAPNLSRANLSCATPNALHFFIRLFCAKHSVA